MRLGNNEEFMPTLEGIVFIPLAFYFFIFRPNLLFPLLIVSTMFEASSVLSSGSIGVQPYYCIAPLYILRFFPLSLRRRRGTGDPSTKLWIAFAIVSVLSAFTLPFLFDGTPVYDPRVSVDDNFISPAHLHFQFTNIVQSVFLALNVLLVITSSRAAQSTKSAQKAFMWSAYFLISVVIVETLFFWLGVPFPTKLLNNNPGYSLANINSSTLRPNGSFAEPSMAGAVLAAFVAAFLWRYFAQKENILRAGIAVLACLFVASTSSFMAVFIALVVLLLANPVLRLPWFVRIDRLKRISVFLASFTLAAVSLLIPAFRSLLLSQTIEKRGSDSALVRLGADAFALNLLIQTHGLGVGLGSNRPSSLITSVLSQVGLVGCILFLCAAWKTFWPLPKDQRWIGMAALGLMVSMGLGLPDLSFPFLWVLICLAVQSRKFHAPDQSS